MRTPALLGLVALVGAGACYREYQEPSTFPAYAAEPVIVSGPPGGGMDPGWGYEAPYAGSGQAYGEAMPEPSADPQAEGYVMGSVTDGEIDQTLAPYGEWIVSEEYGRVWRPYATVVGVHFTPYETCGTWIYTDYGWTFACEWDWGWLPFHYGQWDWFDGGWCWVPGYTWSPAWVDWRYGGGYVGWRPTRPWRRDHRGRRPVVRDHRGRRDVVVRDHRRGRNAHWRFVKERDLGRRNLHAYTRTSIAKGLALTKDVARPPVRANRRPVSVANLMRGRLRQRYGTSAHPRGHRPTRGAVRPTTRGTYRPPTRGTYRPSRGTYRPPTRGTYQPSRGTYRPPTRGTYQPPTRGTYRPPTRGTYQPPTRGTYRPPTRGTYRPPRSSQPPRRYQPSRSYSPSRSRPSRSYSPPRSRPSRSYSPSRSSRPSRSYSRPSRPSRSYSRPSRSHSSRSSGSRSSSHRSSRGGRRR